MQAENNRDRLRDVTALLYVTVICIIFDTTVARPNAVRLRSRRSVGDVDTTDQSPDYIGNAVPTDMRNIHVADDLLCTFMMLFGDRNGDEKLSSDEITYFYRYVMGYSDYVSRRYGNEFIPIADMDGDELLNREELLMMLVAMDAADWTKR